MIIYEVGKWLARNAARLWLRELDVSGTDNVPDSGPFLLVANHQSILDPVLVQAVCPRRVFTMAKSAQFTGPVWGWLMPRIAAFPTRRWEVDPQAVRNVLRYLDRGEAVGIYPEGERSWDGRLQHFRRGSLKLVLKAGVPVIPATIQGSYDVWPRWHRRIRRGRIRIRFWPAITFPVIHDRDEREAALDATRRRLVAALQQGASPPEAPD